MRGCSTRGGKAIAALSEGTHVCKHYERASPSEEGKSEIRPFLGRLAETSCRRHSRSIHVLTHFTREGNNRRGKTLTKKRVVEEERRAGG